MRHLAAMALFFCFPWAAPVEAQEATITINGYAYGQIAGVGHECPLRKVGNGWRVDGYVGMQFSCPVWGIAADSSFTPATLKATASQPDRVAVTMIHSTPDSVYYPDTLRVQVLRQGNWSLDLTASPVLFIMGATSRPADAAWPRDEYPPMRFVVGEVFRLCAYEGGYENATAKSLNRPTPCPDLGGVALPEFEVQWTLPDILGPLDPVAVPGASMAQLSERMDEVRVAYRDPPRPVRLLAFGATN